MMSRTHRDVSRLAGAGAGLSRRELLRGGALLAAVAALPGRARGELLSSLLAPAPGFLPGAPLTQRVVLVVFGGGVRSRETLLSDNTPNLRRIAEQGVSYPLTHVENNGHYAAALSIFTGVTENFGIRENDRSPHPTLFEYLRKGGGLTAADTWLSTSGSEQETNYSYGTDSRYGAAFGANLIGGEGIFNAEFRELLGTGRGSAEPARESQLQRLRAAVRTPLPVADRGGVGNDPEAAARIESYILEELRGGTAAITGLGANDAKALRVARNLLSIFRPKLLAVTLRNADVAHGSFNDYVSVIRRNDAELGLLYDAIRGDPLLASTTALFVLPEFGRDRDLNARRGLDHGDDSAELRQVSLVAWGPDFRRGKVVNQEVRSIDVCPAIASMFRVQSPGARGGLLPGLMA
jgi:hypothetical protein